MTISAWMKLIGSALGLFTLAAGFSGTAAADCKDELSVNQCQGDTDKFKDCKDGTYYFRPSSGLFCTPMGHEVKASKKIPKIATAGGFCSVQMIAEIRATDGCSGGIFTFREKFRPACNQHDICYASPTSGGKAKCDSDFLENMQAMCKHGQTGCKSSAKVMYNAVALGAFGPYSGGKTWAEDNCTNADHYGRLKHKNGRCVDLMQEDIGKSDKYRVDARKCHGGSDHRWRFKDADNQRMIQNSLRTSGGHVREERICLIAPPNSRSGDAVMASACPSQGDLDSGNARYAQWTRTRKEGTGYHTFESDANPGLCLGVQGDPSSKTRDKVLLRTCSHGSDTNKLFSWMY